MSKPTPIAWAVWDTPDRVAAHPAIKDGLGQDDPRLVFITFANGALRVSATRRPRLHLTDAGRYARAAHTWIEGALVSEPDRHLHKVAETLRKRLQLEGYRNLGNGLFEALPVEDALAMLAGIRDIAGPPQPPVREPAIPAFLRKENSMPEAMAPSSPKTGDIVQFNFGDLPVRVVPDDHGELWFVATDVARILDYRNAPDMTRNLDEDEKGTQIVRTPGGQQKTSVISESGLFAAILKSRKPEARKFRKWVTSEVLPSIRKTGSYAMPGAGRNGSSTGHPLVDEAIEFRAWREADWMRRLLLSRLNPEDPVSVETSWTIGNRVRVEAARRLAEIARKHLAQGVRPEKVAAWMEAANTDVVFGKTLP
ncbi:Bro-N domain-containing protein [Tepidiphilus succinatimandens]|uniref:BRO-N domain-containing protein n=1 Tax=Tepidiphilus succinatimandens TaxID=224436 RepID=UPI00197D74B3|nr:Bro-N domain-containing protein [Tepidiphilus succinatimandens]